MNRHYMSNEYKVLCDETNNYSKRVNNRGESSNGWIIVDSRHDTKSNFKGVLYYKNGQYAMCFAGTDSKSRKDVIADLKIWLTGNDKQITKAQEFAKDMMRKYPEINSNNTVSIGHSEGGTEATVVGVNNGLKTYTYNALKVGDKYVDKKKDYGDWVTNYRDPGDPVSKLGANVGDTYIVPSSKEYVTKPSKFGIVQAHRVENMGDCTKCVTPDEYKSKEPNFINSISNVNITQEDIGKMPSEIYRIYEKEIDNRVAQGKIKSANQYNSPASSTDGKWVTINGNHVLIKD